MKKILFFLLLFLPGLCKAQTFPWSKLMPKHSLVLGRDLDAVDFLPVRAIDSGLYLFCLGDKFDPVWRSISNYVPAFPSDPTLFLRGDSTWASITDVIPPSDSSNNGQFLQVNDNILSWASVYTNLAWGSINADSTIASSSDNFTITHPSAGVYVITLDATPTDATCTATISGTTFGFITSSVSGAAITIRTDATGVSVADRAFNFIVTGTP